MRGISHGKLIGVVAVVLAAGLLAVLIAATLSLVDERLPIGIGFHPR